jgi:RNA polymerase sigma factor (sigma-70 family)
MKRYPQKPAYCRTPDWPRPFDDLYPVIRRVAGARAATVARTCGLSYDERSDLEQDSALEVWRKLSVFDPSRSSIRTFIERIVANRMVSSVRRLRAEKRRTLPSGWTPHRVQSEGHNVNLRIDVLRVLNGLEPGQRDLCRMLSEHSPSEVSRRAGVSRSTIYRIIGELRVAFTDAGLEHFPRSNEVAAFDLSWLSTLDVASSGRCSRQD